MIFLLAHDKKKKNSGGGVGGKVTRRVGGNVKSSLKKLRLYGKDVPANVSNKILLLEAETETLSSTKGGKKSKDSISSKFIQSIDEARRYGLIHEEAYANERYAIALLGWDDVPSSLEYFARAKCLYEKWGSPVKVERLVSYVREKSGVNMHGQ